MALVRILSDDAQYRENLKHDLQARGFEVEAADAEGGEDAPPQISISECSFEDLPKLAASLQQGTEAAGQVSTDAIAFLVPQLLSGNTRSLKAFVVRSKPEPELAQEAQATPQSVPNELRDRDDAALSASASVPLQAGAQQAREAAVIPKFKAHFRKKKEEEPELVPHGLIWQAISEASAVSAQQPSYEIAGSQENISAPASLRQEPLKRESPETEPPKREFSPAKDAPARLQSFSTFPYRALRIRPAKLRLLVPFRSKSAGDRRFRNVAAFALGAAILAVLALPHVHRLAPLPSNVEAHIAQPAESVPAHVSDKPSPTDGENVSRHPVAVAQPVKNVASSSHEEKSGLLAKDTVVHFAPKTTQSTHDLASKQPQRKDGVRYISDLD